MPAAALVALLVATIEAFAVVVSALVTASMVVSALVTASVVMPTLVTLTVVAVVIAFGVGVILQRPLGQCLCGCVRETGHTAVKLNPSFGQRILCTHADASANQRVYLGGLQKACQCAVPAAVRRNDLLCNDLTILHVVELELLSVAEMLENLSVSVSYCDSHIFCSFLNDILCSLIVEPIVSTPDQELFSIYQCRSNFSPCALVNGCHSGAGNAHLFGALLLRQAFAVKQADRLELIQSHDDRFPG